MSDDWERLYRAGRHTTKWPWSDLVSVVSRAYPTGLKGMKVLELGCGPGANIPFFLSAGATYYGIEGSVLAAGMARNGQDPNKCRIMVGDFTRDIPFDGPFDLVVDRAALIHNDDEGISRGLTLVRERLTAGGLFFGIDWFSSAHEDSTQFAGIETVNRMSEDRILAHFRGWDVRMLEHKIVARFIPPGATFGAFNIVAEKRC